MRPTQLRDLKILDKTGDDDALTYGGGVVFRKDDKVFWQFWDAPGRNYLVWTARVGRSVLQDYPNVNRKHLASDMGLDMNGLRAMAVAADPRDRRQMVEAIGELEGRSVICPTGPEELTNWEMKQRWGDLYQVDTESVSRFAPGDYAICEYDEGWACGQIGGDCLGVYEAFEGCLAVIANEIDATGLMAEVFILEKGEMKERLDWNPGRWRGQPHQRIRLGFSGSSWRYRMRPFAREAGKKERKTPGRRMGRKRPKRGTIRKTRT
jgi:hypothetical protein